LQCVVSTQIVNCGAIISLVPVILFR
jgi:hypothetical protein